MSFNKESYHDDGTEEDREATIKIPIFRGVKCPKCGHGKGSHYLKKHIIEGYSESGKEYRVKQTQSKMFKQKHEGCGKPGCSCLNFELLRTEAHPRL